MTSEIKTYDDPKKAYAMLNNWNKLFVSYETLFTGKKVNKVNITFIEEKPIGATFYYSDKQGNKKIERVSLSGKIKNKPRKKELISYLD